MKAYLFSASAVALLHGISPAAAQTNGSETDREPQQSVSRNDADIVVTANRRSESVQNVPLAITAITGETLTKTGVNQVQDLQNLVPGLAIAQNGAAVVTVLRGVGAFVNDANAESAIAYNINGVYIARPAGIGPIFYDLERVEVLKGPQGTLYGRNASGGAINLITMRPGHRAEGYFNLDLGNYDLVRATGAATLPIGDTLSLRAAGQFARRNGYLSGGYNDEKSEAARLTALWEPSADLSLLVTGEYTHIGGAGSGSVKRSVLQALPSDPWTGVSDPSSQPPSAAIPGGTVVQPGGPTDITVWAISAELNYDFGPAQLTFIPAYRDTRPVYTTYDPSFLFETAETSKAQSYELRLGNASKTLKWVAGLYYFDEAQTQKYLAQALPFQSSRVDTTLGTKAWAAFGEATLSLANPLRVIGGIRYSEDKKHQDGTTTATLPRPGSADNFGRRKDDNISWKAGLEYDLGEQNLLFLTVASGFKAGGFFPTVPFPDNQFRPEKLTAFTLGSRNRFLDNSLQINLEVFYWKYHDKQERFLGLTQTGTTAILTTNAGRATLYGGAIDVQYRPSQRDRFQFNAEYLHSKYDEFSFVTFNAPPFGVAYGYSPLATGCRLGPIIPITANDPAVPTDSLQQIDCSGKPLVRAPKFAGSASYEHVFELKSGATITPAIRTQFASRQYVSTDFIASAEDDGFITFDASLTLATRGETFALQAWVKNITKEAIYNGGFRYLAPATSHQVPGR